MDGEAAETAGQSSLADDVLDDLMPEGFEWREMVSSYPMPALAISTVCGFFLGRKHGAAILDALTSFASSEVDRNISSFLGRDSSESRQGSSQD